MSEKEKARKTLLSGLQPSGTLHIGNYFGALKPFAEFCVDYDEIFLLVVDYHALTTIRKPEELRKNSVEIVKDYLAVLDEKGVDRKKVTIFKQSDVSEHTELAWIFECLVSVPFLMQGHAYKDKVANKIEASAGLFNYPMLMAADILLYDQGAPITVPVGEDQRQHLEYAREAAAKFNSTFGQTFTPPKALITKAVAVVPGTDGRKMSKSYGNTIPLFGSKDEIVKAVMSIVTDSKGTKPENVYALHRLLKTENELKELYEANQGNYKMLKEKLTDDLEVLIAPMRERREKISENEVRTVLEEGRKKAKEQAGRKMEEIRQKIGVSLS